MLLQPQINGFLNHWAECKSYNQHFHLTAIIVPGSFIAKLVHLLETSLGGFFQLSCLSCPPRPPLVDEEQKFNKSPCKPAWGHSDQWISTLAPPPPSTNDTRLRLTWHNDKQIPFIVAQGDGHAVCLRRLHKRRCVAAFQSETLSRP